MSLCWFRARIGADTRRHSVLSMRQESGGRSRLRVQPHLASDVREVLPIDGRRAERGVGYVLIYDSA